LIEKLEIGSCLVTIDAMGCQSKIAQTIIEKDADYLLALTANHGLLYEDVVFLFDDLAQSGFTVFPHQRANDVDKGHGRIEVRQVWTIDSPHLLANLRTADKWPHLTTLVKVQSERYLDGKQTLKARYFISSLLMTASAILDKIRSHWAIENNLHWVLDIAFREDESRAQRAPDKDHEAQNSAVLRHIALNLLKQDKTLKLELWGQTPTIKTRWRSNWSMATLASC
jgi:predicted transposase YbfD/YdcC